MKAMLLAAGRGERLRPWSDTTPKCMLPFQGKPLLEHWLERLRAFGVCEVVINVHHLAETVVSYFGSGKRWDMAFRYSREPELLGTSGAVREVRSFFADARFLVIYADSQTNCELRKLVEFHAARGGLATMAACWIEDPRSSGIVDFNQEGRVTRFLEKPGGDQIFTHYINAGIYVFEPEIFDHIPAVPASDFSRDVFPQMLAAGVPLYAFRYDGYVLRFDTMEEWKKSEALAAKHLDAGAWQPAPPGIR
jgi:NDP-sugar pyrophosphorylase family protein